MPLDTRPESGFLVLADISGFTKFVTATEIEHGAETTGVLLADVIAALAPPLEIQELEGDAVFALGPDRAARSDAELIESFGRALVAFRRRQVEISLDESCRCRACAGVLALRLKLIVHHGSFVRQSVAGRSRVAGPDVILAHRLLKNDVEPATYVLFTGTAVQRIGIDPAATGMRPYTGAYAYFGEVDGFVVALDHNEILLGLRPLLGDLALDADPGPHDDLRPVVAA
ncbi:MAG: hypothetical protein DME05_01965 [Candidatus Rokuibacteriota bacterium]|nr:MAG: hypothetical protein DME05_01965 [Candidatus Rokubacteria bacterium]